MAMASELATVDDEREPSLFSIIAQALKNPQQIDVAVMNGLLDFKLRVEARDAEIEFNKAFASLQAILPPIVKDGVIDLGQKGKIPFATFENVMAVMAPLLREYGFSQSFPSEETESGVLMTMILTHRGGHSRYSKMRLPSDPGPGRNNLQAIGSSRSYGKRYMTCDMWNIVIVGEDKDGTKPVQYIDEEQERKLEDLITDAEFTPEERRGFLAYMEAPRLAQIPVRSYTKAFEAIKAKKRKKQEAR